MRNDKSAAQSNGLSSVFKYSHDYSIQRCYNLITAFRSMSLNYVSCHRLTKTPHSNQGDRRLPQNKHATPAPLTKSFFLWVCQETSSKTAFKTGAKFEHICHHHSSAYLCLAWGPSILFNRHEAGFLQHICLTSWAQATYNYDIYRVKNISVTKQVFRNGEIFCEPNRPF